MDIYTTTIAISVLIYVAIGNYAGRSIKRLDDYYVDGRRAPSLFILGTLIASVMSSTIFLGEAGFAYAGQAGPYVLFPQISSMGFVLGAILFGRYLRRSRTKTVADFFGRRFNSKRVQAMAGITIILGLGGYLLAVTQGAAILLSQLTDLNYVQGVIVAWLSYTSFTMYSGSRGVILTDTIMFILFTFVSLGAAVYLVSEFGGWPSAIHRLVAIEEKVDLMSWHGVIGPGTAWPTAMDFLIWELVVGVSWILVIAVSPWQSSRHLMARNEHVVLRAACLACLAATLLQVIVYGMGAIVNLGKTDIVPYESATIWASLNLLPELLGALMLAGIMAAALSSASTFLSLVGFSVSNDLGLHKKADERTKLRLTRLMMLAMGSIALIAALFFPPNIFWLTLFVTTIFASSWGPVALMSIWSKSITASGAFWGMLSGLVFNVVPKFFEFIGMLDFPSYLNPVIIGTAMSLVVTVVVSKRTTVSHEEVSYLLKLHETPADEISAEKTRTSLFPPALLIANGVIMPFLLITYHVRPYQSATGTLSEDGSLDWFAAETIIAMSWSVVWISLGIFAIKAIRRAYMPSAQ